jgi:hypothetical protein
MTRTHTQHTAHNTRERELKREEKRGVRGALDFLLLDFGRGEALGVGDDVESLVPR